VFFLFLFFLCVALTSPLSVFFLWQFIRRSTTPLFFLASCWPKEKQQEALFFAEHHLSSTRDCDTSYHDTKLFVSSIELLIAKNRQWPPTCFWLYFSRLPVRYFLVSANDSSYTRTIASIFVLPFRTLCFSFSTKQHEILPAQMLIRLCPEIRRCWFFSSFICLVTSSG
jgi:hypothetical protein